MNLNDPLSSREPEALPIAVRAYPLLEEKEAKNRPRKRWRIPNDVVVFDTESRIDAQQSLTFGSYRYFHSGNFVEEGLFYGESLSTKETQVLKHYVRSHSPATVRGGVPELRLLTLNEFLKELFKDLYKTRCLLIAFNHPFDLSRLAYDFVAARDEFIGGFSLGFWNYADKSGQEQHDPYRPRIRIKHLDSKRALIGLTGRHEPDAEDRIPEGSLTGKPEEKYHFRGHFLDLRTLAFAITDIGHSLESACRAFKVKHGKKRAARHGKVTKEYIDYNRRDVLATHELATKMLEEYGKHHITLQVTKAFSPASIGKGYLGDMGIKPVNRRQRNFPKQFIGYAQSAFYGGRASAHIRKSVVPVVYTDFLSMYPTVNSLMGLWRFVIAREIKVVRRCGPEINDFLARIKNSPSDLFKPRKWRQLCAFVRVIPNGDILPSRSKYSLETNDWQAALNRLTGGRQDSLWYSLPDVVASVLLTGQTPKIIDSFRIEPSGVLDGLRPIKLRSSVDIDPRTQDFFKVAIEQRTLLTRRNKSKDPETERVTKALKVLANAASYGIYAEMNRQESETKVHLNCQGIDAKPYSCFVAHPEKPGQYCFPPLASLITGAARLMLALLEYSVSKLGGTYAMEDTDSMAIVATKKGGLVACAGGPYGLANGEKAIKALSWRQVEKLSERFEVLNPYDRESVPGSILKIEDDNRDSKTKRQRQLYCLAISAKRYLLFLKSLKGAPVLLRKKLNNEKNKWSQHGLGHLLNPSDPESDNRDWISKVWLNITRRALGRPTSGLGFEQLPAVGRMPVSSPAVMRPLASLNEGKRYADQIKPFNFLLTCHVKHLGHPPGVDRERFQLIAPYDKDPKTWLKKEWINKHNGKTYWVTTSGYHGSRTTARVNTYGEVLEEYEFHPEAKCADMRGNTCSRETVGLLRRRHIRIDEIKFIGKESNSLEEVESGLEHSTENVVTYYRNLEREWNLTILPLLKTLPLKVLVNSNIMSRRALIDVRAGRSRPHRKNCEKLIAVLKKRGLLGPRWESP